ncbi:hypothetical protein AC65_4905 [Escherichia coli 2-005-03_S4_C1]|nr:Hypothetical protein FORC43_3198 [Escherichia coli]KDA76840.1 hypothetical protein AC13_4930 [Escherichia coli 2-011-08_S3_C2]KDW69543.1 hypothetical protein AC65_4905 [Escherichia coli 2-005-03_S4_C1]KDX01406.1 hypothetical protein AD27_5556 [Escherichia coli 2-177-06_S4_C3]KDY83693.1 hypothetical protein AB92_4954 [Escherichia coli 2-474-04_S3_C1]KDY85765.1 hypothetical protein AC21_4992 [Escherichia coli 2-474-04_S3_C2]
MPVHLILLLIIQLIKYVTSEAENIFMIFIFTHCIKLN